MGLFLLASSRTQEQTPQYLASEAASKRKSSGALLHTSLLAIASSKEAICLSVQSWSRCFKIIMVLGHTAHHCYQEGVGRCRGHKWRTVGIG